MNTICHKNYQEKVLNLRPNAKKYGYVGETDRWGTKEGEHKDKVRLTLEGMKAGKEKIAERKMNSGDGRLACEGDINWEEAKVIGRERRWSKRKLLLQDFSKCLNAVTRPKISKIC